MNAVPNNVVAFELPKKPRVKQKDAPPDQRSIAVVPIRAATDDNLTDGCVRVLIVLCSYCNRAGITWVSQARLAADMKVSRQAITNQIAQLRKHGYVEIVKKGWRGERANTIRVIFDKSVDTDTAIAVTSVIEDTRPPERIQEEERKMDEQIDREGQKRIASMIAGALKQPTKPKERTMPKEGDTLAVRKIKEGMKKAPKRTPIGHSTVSNESSPTMSNEGSHRQSIGHSTVSQNTENTVSKDCKVDVDKELIKLNKVFKTVLSNEQIKSLNDLGLNDHDIADALDTLLAAYAAEGLTPTSQLLTEGILQLHRDVR
jgi:hypothetical protein